MAARPRAPWLALVLILSRAAGAQEATPSQPALQDERDAPGTPEPEPREDAPPSPEEPDARPPRGDADAPPEAPAKDARQNDTPEPAPPQGGSADPTQAPAAPDEQPQRLDAALADVPQDDSPPPPPREGEGEPKESEAPLPEGSKRDVPSYDGREPRSTDAGDVVRWGPRALFFPAYLVLEYGVRIPTVWAITRVEESKIAEKVEDFFTWDDGRAVVYPTVYVDFGLRPNLGARLEWESIAPRHDIQTGAFVGFNDLFAFGFQLDQHLFRDPDAMIRWNASYVRRPDNVFFGVSDVDARCNAGRGCRYRSAIADAYLGLVGWEETLNQIHLGASYRHARFSRESDPNHPALTAEEASDLEGFAEGYQLVKPELDFTLDTREEDVEFTPSTGLRFEGTTSFNLDVQETRRRWFRAGGEASAFWEFGHNQVLGVGGYYEALVNLGELGPGGERAPVPFHELVFLGGSERMQGFLARRLLGTNAWSLTADYRYAITWAFDAVLFWALGNTFEDMSDFQIARNYMNYGVGLRTRNKRSESFEAILAFGSNRLDEPEFVPFDQVRLTLGINRGF